VRLGIHLPQFREATDGPGIAAFARAAEAAAIDDLWVSDHIALAPDSTRPPARFHDALTVLTWAAAATNACRLGTSVLVAPYRHPVATAKSLASLDALSGGRVVMGIASGWLEYEFAALGADFSGRGRTTDAAIAICRTLWGGGLHDGVCIDPRPVQGAALPVWIGGNSDAGIRRAARLGDGWHTTVSNPDDLEGRLDVLTRELARAGRSRSGFVVSVRVRTDTEGLAPLVPRLERLGVDHILVDHAAIVPDDLPGELSRLRALAGAQVPLPGGAFRQ
jgi:probable F420-dependent oxidoreductase